MPAPYRADHVGSFIRPPELVNARRAFHRGELSRQQLREVEQSAILQILEVQRQAGVDVYSDGEYMRALWLGAFHDAVDGFVQAGEAGQTAPQNQMHWHGGTAGAPLPTGRATVIGAKLRARERITGAEVAFLQAHAPGPFKITQASPTWYLRQYAPGVSDQVYPTREDALADLVAITRDEVRALVEERVPYIQIDSIRYVFDFTDEERRQEWQQWGVDPDQAVEQNVQADNAVLDGPINRAGITFGLHMCRGNAADRWYAQGGYDRIAERTFPRLNYDRFLLEYDTQRAGGFEPLRFVPAGKTVALGLISTKTPVLEHQDDLRRRIDEASRYVPLEHLALAPQCGFASILQGALDWDAQRRKLDLLVDTARKVWG